MDSSHFSDSFTFLKFEKGKSYLNFLIIYQFFISYFDSSHFSDNNEYIICRISIYRFKDIIYAILNE